MNGKSNQINNFQRVGKSVSSAVMCLDEWAQEVRSDLLKGRRRRILPPLAEEAGIVL